MPQPSTNWELTPDTPLQYLKGVGQARATLLEAAGFQTVRDLLYFFPYRYEDRRNIITLRDLRTIDRPVTLRARVVSASLKMSPVKKLRIFEVMLDDGSGSVMAVWFNQPYLKEQIVKGREIVIYGQPRLTNYGRLQFENPDFELVESDDADSSGSILPVYSAVNGIQPKAMRRLVQQSLFAIHALADPLPVELQARLGVVDLPSAITQLHYPSDIDDALLNGESAAHRRIVLEEFFAFQLSLRLRRAGEEKKEKQRAITIDAALRQRVRSVLPFSLTSAQKRVLREIASDMQSRRPMYRLLQGDVGSGKTIVALIAALIAIENGHQAALLAPTEILADQHFERIAQLLDGSPISIAKFTGSTPVSSRGRLLQRLAAGDIQLIVGTHALLEPKVEFKSLGLAIVDEQHRFGVVQRQKLFAKGNLPDILVMTATPIPRSLAIAMYGDLELSVIDELPPGREPVRTYVRGTAQLSKVFSFIDGEIESGAQAYIVFPIIEESEKLDLKPLLTGVETVKASLPARRVGILHGRMSFEEKDATMRAFKARQLDVLVATTVVEVGIDVPNASVMVIIDADRFGFAQMHQLRGRVGRGSRKSYCIVMRNETAHEDAKSRLKIFAGTSDGFAVSERDLEMRGSGDFFGTRQSGAPKFRFGNILRDHKLMEQARDAAIEYIEKNEAQGATSLLRELAPEALRIGTGKD